MSKKIGWVLMVLSAAANGDATRLLSLPTEARIPVIGDSCAGHEQYDDGTIEGAAGYSNSTTNGVYTMAFDARPGQATRIDEVCVCWTKTANATVQDLPFNIVVYQDGGANGAPGAVLAQRSVIAPAVPIFDGDGARFYKYSFAANPIVVPPGRAFIGVQWVPFDNREFFVCADTSPENRVQPTFSSGNGGANWESMATIRPSLRAFGFRALRQGFVPQLIPTLGGFGMLCLFGLVALGALKVLRRTHLH